MGDVSEDAADVESSARGLPQIRITDSELGIIELLASGRTYRQIARALFLSPSTVAYHTGRLQERLHVDNNVALIALCLAAGLLTVDIWPPLLTGREIIDFNQLQSAANTSGDESF